MERLSALSPSEGVAGAMGAFRIGAARLPRKAASTGDALRDDKGGGGGRITYEPVAGGTSLLERIEGGEPGHAAMISVYHMDGDDLVMTHYCGHGNQPTMKAAPGGDQIAFSMTSVTNLAKPTDGHMHGLEVTFLDQDHFRQEWLWTANGKDEPHVFNYTRVRK